MEHNEHGNSFLLAGEQPSPFFLKWHKLVATEGLSMPTDSTVLPLAAAIHYVRTVLMYTCQMVADSRHLEVSKVQRYL